MADKVVSKYLANLRMVRALGHDYGFEVCFFWQPQLFTDSKQLTESEMTLLNHPWLGGQTKELTTAVYNRIRDAVREDAYLIDIRDAFQGMAEQVYFDPCHVNGCGNRRVAEMMLSRGGRECVRRKAEAVDRAQSLTQLMR